MRSSRSSSEYRVLDLARPTKPSEHYSLCRKPRRLVSLNEPVERGSVAIGM